MSVPSSITPDDSASVQSTSSLKLYIHTYMYTYNYTYMYMSLYIAYMFKLSFSQCFVFYWPVR